MTTNAGAAQASRRSMGFTEQDHSTDATEVITRTFSPEFRNRLDAIIQFNPLSRESIGFVVDKFVNELELQLQEKKVILHLDEAARLWLGEHGFEPKMGARPMARVIQESIKKPLAEELLFGRLVDGGEVSITVKDDKLEFEIHAPEQLPA